MHELVVPHIEHVLALKVDAPRPLVLGPQEFSVLSVLVVLLALHELEKVNFLLCGAFVVYVFVVRSVFRLVNL